MSNYLNRKTLIGGALSVGLMAALLVPAAMAGEKTLADHQKGQAAESQKMDHSQMNHGQMDHSKMMQSMGHDGMDHSKMAHGSMNHEPKANQAAADRDHDQ
ncbi:copper resistance protein CopB [Pseudomonas cavernae]|uniref:Copper resistance protein CopB n=1 Tax=Pseudomonas cavernae TaxID=2320867 RepID=A0A385Z256_9PSED|nr:copper resistance protein CopB [Pseudomonas cavernae]AYC33166.1 copper resistance protein CopB [Pseudomonas cavernae]